MPREDELTERLYELDQSLQLSGFDKMTPEELKVAAQELQKVGLTVADVARAEGAQIKPGPQAQGGADLLQQSMVQPDNTALERDTLFRSTVPVSRALSPTQNIDRIEGAGTVSGRLLMEDQEALRRLRNRRLGPI